MAIGKFRRLLTFNSYVGSLAALALMLFATLSSISNKAKPLNTIHFLRIDFSNKFDISSIVADSADKKVLQSAAKTFALLPADFGMASTYILTNWGYCESSSMGKNNLKYDLCTKTKALYDFDPATFFQQQVNNAQYSNTVYQLIGSKKVLPIELPSKVANYGKTIKPVSKLIFICSFIAIGAFAVQLLNNLIAYKSRIFSIGSFLLGMLGTTAALLAAAAATGLYQSLKSKFTSEMAATGITPHFDPQYYGLIWGSFLAGVMSTFGWFLSICFGETHVHHDEDYEDEKY